MTPAPENLDILDAALRRASLERLAAEVDRRAGQAEAEADHAERVTMLRAASLFLQDVAGVRRPR